MSATERVYKTIGGVPLHYVRATPHLTRVYVRSTKALEYKLDRLSENFAFAPPPWYGRLRWIGTAGAYVNKPGLHGKGRAFDLDVVRWRHIACRPLRHHHASRSLAKRRRYLAVDALTRRWFKYVLDGWYNPAHRDHLHLDDGGGAVVFNPDYRSDVVFIQRTANMMTSAGLRVDGRYGNKTDRAFHRMKNRAGVRHRVASEPRVYRRFLWRVAVLALRNKGL